MPAFQVPFLDIQSGLSSETETLSSGRSSAPSNSNRKQHNTPNTPSQISATCSTPIAKEKSVEMFKTSEDMPEALADDTLVSTQFENLEIFEDLQTKQAIKKFQNEPQTVAQPETTSDTSEIIKVPISNNNQNLEIEAGEYKSVDHYGTSVVERYQQAGDKFRERKALSQIDCQAARKAVTFFVGLDGMASHNSDILQKANGHKEPFWCMVTHFMLNAYRKKRSEAKKFNEEVETLTHANKRLHSKFLNMRILLTNEQRRSDSIYAKQIALKQENERLRCNDEHSQKTLNENRSTIKNLEAKVVSMEELIADLESKNVETMKELLKAEKELDAQKDLNTTLSFEKSLVEEEVLKKNEQVLELQEKYNALVNVKNLMLQRFSNEIEQLKEELKTNHGEIVVYQQSEEHLKHLMFQMETELHVLQDKVDAALSQKLRRLWCSFKAFQRGSLLGLHWLAFYMLPATPPPFRSLGPMSFK